MSFPIDPQVDEKYSFGTRSYSFNGAAWDIVPPETGSDVLRDSDIDVNVLSLTGDGSELTELTAAQVGLENVDNTSDATKDSATAVLSNKTLAKSAYTQIDDVTLDTGTYTFDYANGDRQKVTVTGDVTIAFSNFVPGKVCTVMIDAIGWGDWTPVYPDGMLFAGGTEPTLTVGGRDLLKVTKDKDDVYELIVLGLDVKVMA